MSVAAKKPYSFPPRDTVDKFHGNQVLYIGWDDHLMFCSSFAFQLPPTMRFGDVVEKVLPATIQYHPDTAKIDWTKTEWTKSGQSWTPDFDKTLAENGLRHKDSLCFKTPGLNGINGSGS